MRFLHIADVHLGYKQYGSEERLRDFAQAFKDAVKYGVEKKVDFIIIAGDLFHKKSEVDPLTLTQATKVLEIPKKAEIPVIAVEGNHDSTYFKDRFSWMDYLAANEYLINLKPSFDNGILVEEWDGENGAYVDIGETRIYGMKYYGSLTEKILEEYSKKIKKRKFTIFVAHVGIEGYMNIYGCIPSSKLHKLKDRVDYVALGHIHKSFVEDFIFNPGSLETCDAAEYQFKRGAFLVDYDGEIRHKFVEFPKREFYFLECDVKSYDDLKTFLKNQDRSKIQNSVLHLTLKANKSVKKMLDDLKLQKIVKEILNPLVVRVKWDIVDEMFEPILDLKAKKSIEAQVIEQLLDSFPYGNIAEEVLRLKTILSTSYDVKSVDTFIESILSRKLSRKTSKKTNNTDKVRKMINKKDEDYEWEWWKVNDRRGRASKR